MANWRNNILKETMKNKSLSEQLEEERKRILKDAEELVKIAAIDKKKILEDNQQIIDLAQKDKSRILEDLKNS